MSMRWFFLLTIFTLNVFSQSNNISFSYFESLNAEAEQNRTISKVVCDPNKKDLVYYITYDKLYVSENSGWRKLIDLAELSDEVKEDEESDKAKLDDALRELYEDIYEEEKTTIEDEYSIDDAESEFEDLLQERVVDRFEDESQSLIEDYKYLKFEKEETTTSFSPIRNLIFLQNLSSHLIVHTIKGFYNSINGGQDFYFQSNETMISADFDKISYSKTQLLVASFNKLYLFDSNDMTMAKVNINDYNDEKVINVVSFFPYVVFQTDSNIYVLKQDEDRIILFKKIPFISSDIENDKIYYFGGKDLFLTSKDKIYIFDVVNNNIYSTQFPYYDIFDIKYREGAIYIGTDIGLIYFDLTKQVKDEINLGLLPEQVKNISISSDKKIYVTNDNDIYLLREFKSIDELSKNSNVFALMKTITLKYPKIADIIDAAYKYNYVSNELYSSMTKRNKVAEFLPILKLKYNYQAISQKGVTEEQAYLGNLLGVNYSSATTNKNHFFEGFLYFDLSKWVFDTKEMRVSALKHEKNMVKERIAEQITYIYNMRQIMEILYLLNDNIKEKMLFKLKMMEYGSIINALTGKTFF